MAPVMKRDLADSCCGAGWDEGILGTSSSEGMTKGEKATLTITR